MSAKHKGKGPQALTANELREGFVVWLTADFEWSLEFKDALLTEDADQIEKMRLFGEAQENENIVVGVYFIDTDPETGEPMRYREKFRVSGPSYDPDQKYRKVNKS